MAVDKVEPDDATCHAAEVVAIYTACESDGSSGLRFTVAALDGPHVGHIREVFPDWVVLDRDARDGAP